MSLDPRIQKIDRVIAELEQLKKEKSRSLLPDTSQSYLKTGVMPTEFAADAEHIAAATVLDAAVLVSWNLRHIVNVRTKMMVKEINSKFGYKVPDIVRPDEVL